MIRPESGGSDCTMEAGFRENSVYSTYTQPDHKVSGKTVPDPPGNRRLIDRQGRLTWSGNGNYVFS